MYKYDYKESICENIKLWIEENKSEVEAQKAEGDESDLADWLNDQLWAEDSITGNGLDYYNTEEACQEYVASNLTLYFEAANEFCNFPNNGTPWIYKNPAQHMDTTIRCYLLGECIWKLINEGEI